MKTRSNSPRTCFLRWFLHSCIQYPRELDQGSTWAGLENVEDTPFRSVYKVDYRKAKTKKESTMKSTIPIESFHPFLPMKCSFHNNWTAGKTPFHGGCYSIKLIYFLSDKGDNKGIYLLYCTQINTATFEISKLNPACSNRKVSVSHFRHWRNQNMEHYSNSSFRSGLRLFWGPMVMKYWKKNKNKKEVLAYQT